LLSRFTCLLRRFSRFLCLVVFAAIGLDCSIRSLGAELEFYWAKRSDTVGQALFHLHRASIMWPLDYPMRAAPAYFWVATRLYVAREFAIPDIKAALVRNPNAADLWYALAEYEEAGGEDATEARKHLRALWMNYDRR